MTTTRNAFKLFVSIEDSLSNVENFLQKHDGFPIDNVIQIKLSKSYFTDLFRDVNMTTSTTSYFDQRYNSEDLLLRIQDFFDKTKYHNHNTLSSDVTILVKNTYNDVDINPVTLEQACSKDGEIFDYFFKSNCVYNRNDQSSDDPILFDEDPGNYENTSEPPNTQMKVYQVIAREIDNMIARNYFSTSEDLSLNPDTSYDDLDAYYTIYENKFWENIQIGDSIFIEGSFLVPTSHTYTPQNGYVPKGSGNLPVILQFVCSDNVTYGFQVPPILFLPGPSSYNIEVSDGINYQEPGYSALNYLGTDISSEVSVTSNTPENLSDAVLGTTYSVNYSITADGFTVTKTRSVIYDDNVGPVITLDNSQNNVSGNTISFDGITGGTKDSYSKPSASAVDEWDNNIKLSTVFPQVFVSDILLYSSKTNGYHGEVNYTSTDTNQNNTTNIYFIVLLSPITMLGGTNVSFSSGSYVEPGFSAFEGFQYNTITVNSNTFTTESDFANYLNSQTTGTYSVSYDVSSATVSNETFNRSITLT